MYPSVWMKNWTTFGKYPNKTADYMKRTGMTILVVIDSDEKSLDYKTYWDGWCKKDQIKGIIYNAGDRYIGREGQIIWAGTDENKKPVVSARYSLWTEGDGGDGSDTIANKLNAIPVNVSSQEGYSIVMVHAWDLHCYQNIIGTIKPESSKKLKVFL